MHATNRKTIKAPAIAERSNTLPAVSYRCLSLNIRTVNLLILNKKVPYISGLRVVGKSPPPQKKLGLTILGEKKKFRSGYAEFSVEHPFLNTKSSQVQCPGFVSIGGPVLLVIGGYCM